MEASLKIQASLITQLKAKGFRVYDFPPKSVKYPFIMIGEDRQQDLDVKNGDYVNVSSTILIFSLYNGKKEVKQIMEQIRQVCHDIEVDGFKIVGATVEDSFTVLDEKNQVTQGVLVVNFRLIKGG